MACPNKSPTDGLTTVIQLLVVISLFHTGNQAAENRPDSENQEQLSDLPTLELLEFLGSFETDAGEWIDPTILLQDDFELLLENAEAQTKMQAIDSAEIESKQAEVNDDN